MARKAILEITNCSQCPFLEMRRYYTADSFENAHNWHCKKRGNKKIQGYVEWHEEDKVEIPEWCPLTNKKEKDDTK